MNITADRETSVIPELDAEESMAALLQAQVNEFNKREKKASANRVHPLDCSYLLPSVHGLKMGQEPDTPQMKDTRPLIDRAAECVALTYQVPKAELFGFKRDKPFMRARRCLVALLREVGWSYPQIGRAMGKNHATCINMNNRFYLEAEESEKQAALDIAAHVEGKKAMDLSRLRAEAKARSKSFNAKFCGYMIIHHYLSRLAPKIPTQKSYVQYRYAVTRCLCVVLGHYKWTHFDTGQFLDISEPAVRKHITFYNEHKSFDEVQLVASVIDAVESLRMRLKAKKEL